MREGLHAGFQGLVIINPQRLALDGRRMTTRIDLFERFSLMSDEAIQHDLSSRAMPEFVKRGLVPVSGGGMYLKAAFRVMWMRHEHPDWCINTSIEYADWEREFVVVRASVVDETGRVLATAHAEEKKSKLPFVRKAETSAIARALGLCGYGTEFGEFDEEDLADSPRPRTASGQFAPTANGAPALNDSGAQCPSCHAPNGAKHTPKCNVR